METSINNIGETVKLLTNNQLLLEIQDLSNSVESDLSDISTTLNSMGSNYNHTIRMFNNVENTLETFHIFYEDYNLYIFWYIGLGIVGFILTLQICTLLVKAIKLYPVINQYLADGTAFREARMNLRQERAIGQMNQAIPLVRRPR